VQRAEGSTVNLRSVSSRGGSTGRFELGENHSIELVVVLVVLGQARVEELDGRELASVQQAPLLDGGQQCNVHRAIVAGSGLERQVWRKPFLLCDARACSNLSVLSSA